MVDVKFLTPFNYSKKRFAFGEKIKGESLVEESDYVDVNSLIKKFCPNFKPGLHPLHDANADEIMQGDAELFDSVDMSDVVEKDLSEISEFMSVKTDKALETKNKKQEESKSVLSPVTEDEKPEKVAEPE